MTIINSTIKVGVAVLIVFLLQLGVFAQGSDRVVKATGYASADGLRPGDKLKVAIAVEVGEGYHINAHRPSLDFLIPTAVAFGAPAGFTFADEKYPAPKHRRLEFAPETELAVHEGTVFITAELRGDSTIKPGPATITALVTVQACNDSQCLAPSDLSVEIPIKIVAANLPIKDVNPEIFAKAAAQPEASEADSGALVEYQGGSNDSIADQLAAGGILSVLVGVFFAGLLLNTTPCVYPIIPITIGFFVNQSAAQKGKPKISKTFFMASMYVLGMALTYSLLGVVAAKSGGLFGAALQNPIVLIVLAGLMIALSLSMFGVYEFKLPESLNRMAT